MKKVFNCILINILLIIIILVAFESILFFYEFYSGEGNSQEYKNKPIAEKISSIKNTISILYFENRPYKYFNPTEFREKLVGKNSANDNKNNIVLLGCSFTYGDGLDEFSNFSGQLSKQINGNIYNLGVSGGSPKSALYVLRNTKAYNSLVNEDKNIDYFIYTAILGQEHRNYVNIRSRDPFFMRYKNKKKEEALLYINVPTCVNASIFIRRFIDRIYGNIPEKKIKSLFSLYLKEINKEIEKINPDAKFIVLVYDELPITTEEAEKNCDRVIYTKDLVSIDLNDEEYKGEDNFHPNAKAWELIVPALVKELDL